MIHDLHRSEERALVALAEAARPMTAVSVEYETGMQSAGGPLLSLTRKGLAARYRQGMPYVYVLTSTGQAAASAVKTEDRR